MRRAEPEAELALPHPPPIATVEEQGTGPLGGIWTMSERKTRVGYKTSPNGKMKRSSSERILSKTAKPEEMMRIPGAVGSGSSPEKPKFESATKGRSIETWLNVSLDNSGRDITLDPAELSETVSSVQKKNTGLTNFGIDAASLEGLGLDQKTSERVHRAIFVYSQGIHTVLQDAVSTLKNRSHALLLLWKAFSAVLESAAKEKGDGGQDSLVELIAQGNAEEIARLECEYGEQIQSLKNQLSLVVDEKKQLQSQIHVLEEEEERQRNEKLMYRKDHDIVVHKHELEIRQRMAAEVRFLDKEHWCAELQEDLNKQRNQNQHLSGQLVDSNKVKIKLQSELDDARSTVRSHETQLMECRQQSLESAQQKQRTEHQIGQLKSALERATDKNKDYKDQIENADETKIELQDEINVVYQKLRKAEMALEDETHYKEELQNERDVLRKRLDSLDKEVNELMDSRRSLQKDINDIRIQNRTYEIEVSKLKETIESEEKKTKKREAAYTELVDAHRKNETECGFLREDVKNLEANVKKETELRKSLQLDKQTLQAQVQSIETEKTLATIAVTNSKKELMEITKKVVKIEGVCQQTQQAMQKMNVEHSVERKAQVKKVAMLEKIIDEERKQRRELVEESQDLDDRRTAALKEVEKKEKEIKEVKRQKLEAEEAADRSRILLKDQEKRGEALLTINDRHRSVVANHDAELRQMQVLLDQERAEAKAEINGLKTSYESAKHKLEREIDSWKLRFEDALSLLHFNPMVEKQKKLEKDNASLNDSLKEKTQKLEEAESQIERLKAEVKEKAARIRSLETAQAALQKLYDKVEDDFGKAVLYGEHRSMKLHETEGRLLQLIEYVAAFDNEKAVLESNITRLQGQVVRLEALLNVPKQDGSCQAKPVMNCCDMQTDLSYQYLEENDQLQNAVGRKARLDKLKTAGDFLEDAHAKRDFNVNMKAIENYEIRFEPSAYCKTETGDRSRLQHVAPTKQAMGQLRAPSELPQLVASPKKTPRVLAPQPPPYGSPKPNQALQSARKVAPTGQTPSPWADEGRKGPL